MSRECKSPYRHSFDKRIPYLFVFDPRKLLVIEYYLQRIHLGRENSWRYFLFPIISTMKNHHPHRHHQKRNFNSFKIFLFFKRIFWVYQKITDKNYRWFFNIILLLVSLRLCSQFLYSINSSMWWIANSNSPFRI